MPVFDHREPSLAPSSPLGSLLRRLSCLLPALCLAGCGSDGSTPAPGPKPQASYTVGGSVSGLAAGTSLQLLNNGGDALILQSDGPFRFPTALNSGASYDVRVGKAPKAQKCVVAHGSASSSTDVDNVSVTCSSLRVYAVSPQGDTVGQYSMRIDGSLVPMSPETVPTGAYPVHLALSPDDSLLFVSNLYGASISVYQVGADGALTKTGADVPLPQGGAGNAFPEQLITSADGRFLYVTDNNNSQVDQFAINGTSLSLVASHATPQLGPRNMVFSPVGNWLLEANYVSAGGVGAFAVDIVSGQLGQVSSLSLQEPLYLGITPDARHVYASGTTNIYAMGFDPASGALSPASPATVAPPGAAALRGLAVDVSGNALYVADSQVNAVYAYAIDPSSGALTYLATYTLAAGARAYGLAAEPTGHYLYAASISANAPALSGFTIGASGTLSPMPAASTPSSLGGAQNIAITR